MADHDQLRDCMVAALGITYDLTIQEIEEGIADRGGDYMLELDSKLAEFLLVAAESVAGHALPCPADLEPDQYASLGALLDAALKEI